MKWDELTSVELSLILSALANAEVFCCDSWRREIVFPRSKRKQVDLGSWAYEAGSCNHLNAEWRERRIKYGDDPLENARNTYRKALAAIGDVPWMRAFATTTEAPDEPGFEP